MSNRAEICEKIMHSKETFASLALEIYAYQFANNPLYREFSTLLGKSPANVFQLIDIPFLPISFFKSQTVKTGEWESCQIFSSSGTTGSTTSYHHLREASWYNWVAQQGFEKYFGDLSEYAILALLPAYLEREGSSLIYMVEQFMEISGHAENGFFLYDHKALLKKIKSLAKQKQKAMLIGVTFALLDLSNLSAEESESLMIVETGGMKGRKKEITRIELHDILKQKFQKAKIQAEYGMTELLSQAWSWGDGLFQAADTLRPMIRELNDPFNYLGANKIGALNFIDLGNIDTCAFIATDDLGRIYPDGRFEILGRMDGSDLRGCNLLIGQEAQ